jgi:hypothetical protein
VRSKPASSANFIVTDGSLFDAGRILSTWIEGQAHDVTPSAVKIDLGSATLAAQPFSRLNGTPIKKAEKRKKKRRCARSGAAVQRFAARSQVAGKGEGRGARGSSW